jgi:hypothetical protein
MRGDTKAVTEILGTMLMLGIATTLFTVVYVSVVVISPLPPSPVSHILFGVEGNNLTLTHFGGEAIDNEAFIIFDIGKTQVRAEVGNEGFFTDWDTDNDSKFSFGEKLSYDAGDLSGKTVFISVVDKHSNSLVISGELKDETLLATQLSTYVYDIDPFLQTNSTINLTANGDYRLSKVSLWYRYSPNGLIWSFGYTKFGEDTSYPWKWTFNYPKGRGFYVFYSIGEDGSDIEIAPSLPDAGCYYGKGTPEVEHTTSIADENNTFSFSHTSSGTNRYLLVDVTLYDANYTVSSVSYNGVLLTPLANKQHSSGNPRIEIYNMLNPPIGTYDIDITLTGKNKVGICALSFSNVNQSLPVDTIQSTEGIAGDSPSMTFASSLDYLVVDVIATMESKGVLVGNGQTELWNEDMGTGLTDTYGAGSYEEGASSTEMSWTLITPKKWVMIGFNLR